jgi:hypothetical protein
MKTDTALRAASAEGVILLKGGKPQAARQSFERSIKGMLACARAAHPAGEHVLLSSPVLAVAVDVASIRTENLVAPDNSFEFYNKCFHILDYEGRCCHREAIIASALMYDIAFTYHIEAMNTGRSDLLRYAVSFYRKALRSLLAMNAAPERCVLLMAICNNLGHCCAHVFDRRSINLWG